MVRCGKLREVVKLEIVFNLRDDPPPPVRSSDLFVVNRGTHELKRIKKWAKKVI